MRGRAIAAPLVDRLIAAHGWRTSTTNPLRVDWVVPHGVPKLAGVTGRLGMTYLPGKQYVGWHAPWWRDLNADVELLGTAHGCDLFLLLVEDHELADTRTERLPDAFATHDIELLRHPVVDMDVPSDREEYAATLGQVTDAVRAGKSVVVACRGGLGRTGTAVACILVDVGLSPDDAIKLTRKTRRETIERGKQVKFVHSWAACPPRSVTSSASSPGSLARIPENGDWGGVVELTRTFPVWNALPNDVVRSTRSSRSRSTASGSGHGCCRSPPTSTRRASCTTCYAAGISTTLAGFIQECISAGSPR